MKPLYAILLALVAAILGIFIGLNLGAFGGSVAGAIVGAGVGSCATAQVAVDNKLMTEAQADQLGIKIGQQLRQRFPDLKASDLEVRDKSDTAGGSVFCSKFLAQVKAGALPAAK